MRLTFISLTMIAVLLSVSTSCSGRTDPITPVFRPDIPYAWAKAWGGSNLDEGRDVAVDGSGNVYVTGGFRGTIDFDPGPDVDFHTSKGNYDVFLIKFDPSGAFLWAKTWGGNGGYGVVVDASNNIYVTGCFKGTVDFDPGPGVDNHTSNGDDDIFLSKFDSSGIFLWAKTWGGSLPDIGCSVATDSSGNPCVAGNFQQTADFNPGPDIDNKTSKGTADIFLSKYDSSGIFLWAKAWGGSGTDTAYSIAANDSGNIYITGEFEAAVDFDPGNGTDTHNSNGFYDAFLSKFDASGNFLWAKTWGGSNLDESRDVAIDGSGNVYVTGPFENTVDFDPGSGVDNHSSVRCYDIFLSKFDSSGSFKWARTWGGSSGDQDRDVAIDGSDNVYVTGGFYGTIDFDPGSGIDNHKSNKYYDVFLSKFDSSGAFKWSRTWGGTNWDFGRDITVDGSGNVYITGFFGGTVDFNPGSGLDNHTSIGDLDAFLAKFLPE